MGNVRISFLLITLGILVVTSTLFAHSNVAWNINKSGLFDSMVRKKLSHICAFAVLYLFDELYYLFFPDNYNVLSYRTITLGFEGYLQV